MSGKHHTEESNQKNRQSNLGKKCSEETKNKMSIAKSGEKHPNFKGGRTKNSQGYVLIYSYNHPFKKCGNYVLEHRLVVEKYLGRYLTKEEQVHHVNEIKDDNRIENLICFINNSAHKRFHKDPNNVDFKEIIFDGRELKWKKLI